MADGDREYIGGWLVIEDWRLPWDACIGDPTVKIIGCGEIGEVRHHLFLRAWKEVCRRDLEAALRTFADRVGVEYSPTPTASRDASNDDTAHNGGKP